MRQPPLLAEHPRPVQFILAVVLPAAFGALTGYILGVSEPVYLVFSLLGVLGGIGAGYDHVGTRAGALRGTVAGIIFGSSILIAHEIHGAEPKAHLPHPEILLVVVTTALGAAFGALGGWLRARAIRGAAEEEPSNVAEAAAPPLADPPPPPPVAPATPAAPASAPAQPATDGAVSLNDGSFEDYRGLGMSVTQSKRVLAYRETLGGYRSVDDLDQVPGFSTAFLAEMKSRLTV